jgi:hypothetical protein
MTYVEQELKKRIRLFILQPDDPACKIRIDIQGSLTGDLPTVNFAYVSIKIRITTHRMHPHNRMVIPHRLPANKLAIPPRILRLSETIMLGFKSSEQAFDGFGQSFVSGCVRHPGCVAATCGNAEERQEGQSRWLAFVRYVGVVADCAQFC